MSDALTSCIAGIHQSLTAGRLTVATAESLTAGRLSSALTSLSGSSAYFMAGLTAYSNEAKVSHLGVNPEIIKNNGAVSRECVLAMANGARERFGVDLALSSSGVAGPTGGSPEKPVGLVWLAVSGPWGQVSQKHIFPGDREAVTKSAVAAGLELLRAYLLLEHEADNKNTNQK